MGELFRSEEMTLAQLFLQSEAAYCCVSELGELGMVQFRDLNPDVNVFQRKFVNEVRRCEEMDRKLRFVEKEIKKANIPTVDTGENPEVPFPRDMIDLEATFEKLENELKEINTNQEALKKNFLELTELKHILHRTQQFFNEVCSHMHDTEEQSCGVSVVLVSCLCSFVAGVISRERIPTFERMLWRVCRGNVFLRKAEIEDPLEDPTTGDQVHKSVFIIFFQGDQLKNRVKKICEGFRASLYPCPETPQERKEMLAGVNSRIDDLQMVSYVSLQASAKRLQSYDKHRNELSLHMCIHRTNKCLLYPRHTFLLSSQRFSKRGFISQERSGSTVPSILNRMQTKQTPPTFNKTNKFTSGFQNIVDAYGIGSYREINPAPYTIITFPFLFAVMFGDMGHGLLMTCAALYLVIRESRLLAQKSDNEMFNMIFAGRYIILLMGIFSVYTGVIYNDCFSKSLNMFGSGWSVRPMFGPKGANWTILFCVNYIVNYVVIANFSLQIWNIATNKLTFLNSFKMKMSVILGIIHMIFGVSLSLFNHLYFKKPLNIFLGFIPEIVFMTSLFGYLALLIFYKWTAYTAQTSKDAPSLLIHFINMCLFNYGDPTNKRLYEGQMAIQVLLVLIALACVPCMLIVKTMVLRRQHLWKKHLGTQKFGGVRVGNGPTEDEAGIMDHDQLSQHSEEGDEFDFGDVAVHQAIHTIEYCLGCISNTASYLRLWALSLAHAQLSEVLWSMVMHLGLSSRSGGGFFGLSIIFAFFAVLTVAILLVMEGLSAFLHALRLHWVEFQNKFYSGQGFKFVPFSFESILEGRFDE
uniref:V-type proton ATPase subunit a n=1 Tax=Neolamprologus brichardi TaxID=32507 RepID=A0A3Q4I2G0_NEOBR